MHGQLCFEVPDLPLVLLEEDVGVELDVHGEVVLYLHHSLREAQSGNTFLEVGLLRPDVGDHDGLTVASDGVLEEVC